MRYNYKDTKILFPQKLPKILSLDNFQALVGPYDIYLRSNIMKPTPIRKIPLRSRSS